MKLTCQATVIFTSNLWGNTLKATPIVKLEIFYYKEIDYTKVLYLSLHYKTTRLYNTILQLHKILFVACNLLTNVLIYHTLFYSLFLNYQQQTYKLTSILLLLSLCIFIFNSYNTAFFDNDQLYPICLHKHREKIHTLINRISRALNTQDFVRILEQTGNLPMFMKVK